jgi:NADH-quinone oxidoreductase subunit M
MSIAVIFLVLAFLIPLAGSLLLVRMVAVERSRARSMHLGFAALAVIISILASVVSAGNFGAEPPGPVGLDGTGVVMMPLVALVSLLVPLSTQQTKFRRVPMASTLFSQSLATGMFIFTDDRVLLVLLALMVVPPVLELRSRKKSSRVFVLHMGLSLILMAGARFYLSVTDRGTIGYRTGVFIMSIGVLIRCGCLPFQGWVTDLIDKSSFGSGILYLVPVTGAYTLIRLLMPVASEGALHLVGYVLMANAFFCAGMAIVRQDARKYYSSLLNSLSSHALLGFVAYTSLGMTAGLCMWIAVTVSMTGFGMTIRGLESRVGRLSLDRYHGLYEQTPHLAMFFLITGLASVGFPGTVGFAGIELLLESLATSYPWIGTIIAVSTALNGIAVLRGYFRLFSGPQHMAGLSLQARLNERIALLALSLLILVFGFLPDLIVHSRLHAGEELMQLIHQQAAPESGPHSH